MAIALIVFVWLLNLGISILNAWGCGKAWAETKAHGGWRRFMTWMGAIMSASGFTWCYLSLLAFGAYSFQVLTAGQAMVAMEIGYVIIIPGILFSGMMITIDSWARAYREGGVLNYGVAAYNTYAQIHNTYNAIEGMGGALSDIFKSFGKGSSSSSSDDDAKGAAALVIIILVVVALTAGILTTAAIIKKVAGSDRRVQLSDADRRRLER
jgi:hypothetical protein